VQEIEDRVTELHVISVCSMTPCSIIFTKSQLELKPEKRKKWNQSVISYIDRFLDDFNPNTTFQVSEDMGKGILDIAIEEEGKPMEEILIALKEHVDRPNLNPASPGHLAYIPGGGVYTTALADYMAAATNRFSGVFYACPGAVRMCCEDGESSN